LGVSKYFWFNKNLRDKERLDKFSASIIDNFNASTVYTSSEGKSVSKDLDDNGLDNLKPFDETIEALKDIPKIESPMRKLEYIY
jgi:hypothetical protein